jgi:hypothetical protein
MKAVDVKANASVRILKMQDVDHDHKISWEEYLNFKAYRMKLQGTVIVC